MMTDKVKLTDLLKMNWRLTMILWSMSTWIDGCSCSLTPRSLLGFLAEIDNKLIKVRAIKQYQIKQTIQPIEILNSVCRWAIARKWESNSATRFYSKHIPMKTCNEIRKLFRKSSDILEMEWISFGPWNVRATYLKLEINYKFWVASLATVIYGWMTKWQRKPCMTIRWWNTHLQIDAHKTVPEIYCYSNSFNLKV